MFVGAFWGGEVLVTWWVTATFGPKGLDLRLLLLGELSFTPYFYWGTPMCVRLKPYS